MATTDDKSDIEGSVSDEMSIVVIGDQRAGKTSLLQALCYGNFRADYTPTVGAEYDNRIIDVDGPFVRLNLWDTSGQQNFLWIASPHIKKADGFVFVYDVTDRRSFASVRDWLSLVQRCRTGRDVPKILVGTKLDLRQGQVISCSKAREYAIPENMNHVEVSAKNGKNINVVFYILASEILRHRKLGCVRKLGVNFPILKDLCIHEPTLEVEDGPEYTHLFKIQLLGEVRTGKTALRHRFCRDYFSPEYYTTAGFDYSTRTVKVDGAKIKIQVWDVSGDEVYGPTRKGYYRGANAFVIVYDVTNKASFEKADHLLKELDMYGQSDAPKVVFGNKLDLSHKRRVSSSDVTDWADGWRVPLIEGNAKTGTNVEGAFVKIAMALKRKLAPWKRVYDFSE